MEMYDQEMQEAFLADEKRLAKFNQRKFQFVSWISENFGIIH